MHNRELKKEGSTQPPTSEEFAFAQEMIAGVDLIIRDAHIDAQVTKELEGSDVIGEEDKPDAPQE